MANSFTLTSHSYGGRYIYLECSQGKDIPNNKSPISWKLSAIGGSVNYYTSLVTLVINGETVYSKRAEWDSEQFPAAKGSASGTIDVYHNTNGDKKIDVVMTVMIYDGVPRTYSGSWTLDSLPRASTISGVDGRVIGGQTTVNISRAVSTFTHQLWYKVGDSEWYDLGKGIETSKTFTIDIETAKQFPNAVRGTMQLCVRTFDGTTTIGNDYYYPVIVNVPDYEPTISDIKLTGNNLLDGEYVQGKSTLTAEITAASLYGATIKSYSATVDGKTYSGSKFTSAILSSGSKVVSVTVTDTREKTVELSSDQFTVHEYAIPSITEFMVGRSADGTGVLAYVAGKISPVGNKNTINVSVTLNGITKNISVKTYDINHVTTFTDISTDQTFVATATISDWYTSVSRDAVLPTVAVTMDFHNSGRGVAFGKVAEHANLLDVAWDIKYKGDIINDFVIEQNTDGIWTYRKWASGAVECWGVHTQSNVAIGNTWGSLYESDGYSVNLPDGLFIETPQFNINLMGSANTTDQASGVMLELYSLGSATQSPHICAIRPGPAAAIVGTLQTSIYARGKWK